MNGSKRTLTHDSCLIGSSPNMFFLHRAHPFKAQPVIASFGHDMFLNPSDSFCTIDLLALKKTDIFECSSLVIGDLKTSIVFEATVALLYPN